MSESGFPPPPPPPDRGGPPPPPPPPGGYAAPASGGRVAALAGLGSRLGASIIDTLIIGVPLVAALIVAAIAVPTELVLCQDSTAICEQPTGGGIAVIGLILIVGVLAGLYYRARLDGVRGYTVGKGAMGIRVGDAVTGEPIGIGRGWGRSLFLAFISGNCILGYLWALWDPNNETWHDKVVKSRVYRN